MTDSGRSERPICEYCGLAGKLEDADPDELVAGEPEAVDGTTRVDREADTSPG